MFSIATIGFTIILLFVSLFMITKKKNTPSQIRNTFVYLLISLLVWEVAVLLRILVGYNSNIALPWFDAFAYIGTCFSPIFIFNLSRIFVNSKVKYGKKHFLLYIIPILTLVMFCTNDFHHLFYTSYSRNEIIYNWYYSIHAVYTYALLAIGLFSLLKYSIKNSGFFSRASICICLAIIVPVSLSVTITEMETYFYVIPASFSISTFLLMFSLVRFKLLNITPIALQRIVDRISDGYIVLNEDGNIMDYNQTFTNMFNINISLRNIHISKFAEYYQDSQHSFINRLLEATKATRDSSETVSFEVRVPKTNKYFNIEVNSILSKSSYLGTLVLFKDISQHILDMEKIQENQQTLMEKDRLASLGQLIGGIAHNLKTPIMSIAGASEGLKDLVKEYDSSIEDKEVTPTDHHEIAKEMDTWIEKIKTHTSYMSDVITTVKGQAVALSEQESFSFSMDELVKRVDILMKHELKNALINMNVSIDIPKSLEIKGNINSLIQVINNMISNSIQAYNGKQNEDIDFNITKRDNKLIISIKDYASGIPEHVQKKLLCEMVTTKGKNGTGLRIIYV